MPNQLLTWPHGDTLRNLCHDPVPYSLQVFDVLSDRGLSIEDIRVTEEQSVTDIASGPFFDGVAESWGRGSVAAGKVRTCAMMCGRDLQPFAKQFLTAQQHHPGGAGSGNDAAACADAFTQNKS